MTTAPPPPDIASLATWDAPRQVNTRNGWRALRKAPAPADFKSVWAANETALQAAGVSWEMERGQLTGNLCWWLPVPADSRQQALAFVPARPSAVQTPSNDTPAARALMHHLESGTPCSTTLFPPGKKPVWLVLQSRRK